jgi:molybdopterin-guanine dinucleotide biosynthesis protein A
MSGLRRFNEVSGFVLAGGASRRMGFDKASLPFGSERMVDRQVYEDEIPGQGPLGGIHTGLRRARTEFSLFLSCDMPLMEERFLRYLCEQALASRASATLPPPGAKGRYPLCAVLRRRVLWRVRSRLASGQNQVGRFFSSFQRRTISKVEFARAGFSPRIFCNLNTPEEYKRARQRSIHSAP